jgi:hypothetical protein
VTNYVTYVEGGVTTGLSDRPGPAWPESHGFGPAFDGLGFRNLEAGPKPSMTAGFGLALA